MTSRKPYPKIRTPDFVGSSIWHGLECYAAGYIPTPQNKKEYKELIYLTLKKFPCKECSEHALATWRLHNIDHYMQNADRLYLYISGILHDGANDVKQIPISKRPNYYECKRFIFESMHGSCDKCGGH